MLHNADNSQQDSQDGDADGVVVPPRPDSPQNSEPKKKGQESRLAEQIEAQTGAQEGDGTAEEGKRGEGGKWMEREEAEAGA